MYRMITSNRWIAALSAAFVLANIAVLLGGGEDSVPAAPPPLPENSPYVTQNAASQGSGDAGSDYADEEENQFYSDDELFDDSEDQSEDEDVATDLVDNSAAEEAAAPAYDIQTFDQ
jgi:hypothetical protein